MLKKIFGDLWAYPFHADVWGTVSDWIMVFVSIITAIYLIKTFRSQLRVQNIQQKQFRIQRIKFAESYRPVFDYQLASMEEVENFNHIKKLENELTHFDVDKVVKLINTTPHLPLGLEIIIKEKNEVIGNFMSGFITDSKTKEVLHCFAFCLVGPKKHEKPFYAVFEVKYKDVHKNEYVQEIWYFSLTTMERVSSGVLEMK